MKITMEAKINLKTTEVLEATERAVQLGLRDTIVDIHHDAVVDSPWLTGNNARSIAAEVSNMGTVMQGAGAKPEKVVDDGKQEAACYSTSGYGGYLETGTVKMSARPYFRPALDRHIGKLPENIKKHMESGR